MRHEFIRPSMQTCYLINVLAATDILHNVTLDWYVMSLGDQRSSGMGAMCNS